MNKIFLNKNYKNMEKNHKAFFKTIFASKLCNYLSRTGSLKTQLKASLRNLWSKIDARHAISWIFNFSVDQIIDRVWQKKREKKCYEFYKGFAKNHFVHWELQAIAYAIDLAQELFSTTPLKFRSFIAPTSKDSQVKK